MSLTEARSHNLSKMKFFAFDSFEGLPQPVSDTSVEIWKKGALTTSEDEFMKMVREQGHYVDKVRTVKGYYENSLTDKLQAEFIEDCSKAMLVNIDCDLYESAVPVFNFIEPLLQEGSVIYIDDLFAGYKGSPNKGVAKAFLEYQQRSRWQFHRHLSIGWWGRSYIVSLDKVEHQGLL